MAIVSVRTTSFFPTGLPFAGYIVAGFGVLFIFVNWMVGFPVLLIGVVVATTHYRLIVDTQSMTYKDGVWFLGFCTGPKVPFERIEYLFVKASRESQTMYVRVVRSTVQKRVFDAYLKFSETVKVHVSTRDNKDELLRWLQPIATALKVRINDYTNE